MADRTVSGRADPCRLSAAQAARLIASGDLTAEALVRALANRIRDRDPVVRAWLHVDIDLALRQARQADRRPPAGPLHGLPFGAKDIIDTADMPTTYNSALFAGYRPARDASCVALARRAGAILLGKADTVEFAAGGRRAATTNPHDPRRTPGGSSSGSAAMVADFQVPWSLGTQTGGSLIRPASFCGIYAMKPTWSAVSPQGLRFLSQLDTVGWYGRSVDDLALVAAALGIAPAPGAASRRPRIGICRSQYWNRMEPPGAKAFEESIERLRRAGVEAPDVTLPEAFGGLADAQETIMRGESKAAFHDLFLEFGERLHPDFRGMFAPGGGRDAREMIDAYDLGDGCRREFGRHLDEAGIDLLLTPATPGVAPVGLSSTGDSIFNVSWSLLHVPCIAIPTSRDGDGMPFGCQIVGRRFDDAALLSHARDVAREVDTGWR